MGFRVCGWNLFSFSIFQYLYIVNCDLLLHDYDLLQWRVIKSYLLMFILTLSAFSQRFFSFTRLSKHLVGRYHTLIVYIKQAFVLQPFSFNGMLLLELKMYVVLCAFCQRYIIFNTTLDTSNLTLHEKIVLMLRIHFLYLFCYTQSWQY